MATTAHTAQGCSDVIHVNTKHPASHGDISGCADLLAHGEPTKTCHAQQLP